MPVMVGLHYLSALHMKFQRFNRSLEHEFISGGPSLMRETLTIAGKLGLRLLEDLTALAAGGSVCANLKLLNYSLNQTPYLLSIGLVDVWSCVNFDSSIIFVNILCRTSVLFSLAGYSNWCLHAWFTKELIHVCY